MPQRPLIVLVDDDPSARETFADLMDAIGFRSRTFRSGNELLMQLREVSPDCMVIDVQMPGMSGVELQDRLRNQGCKAPRIFLSGCGASSVQDAAMAGGAFAYLRKPADGIQLEHCIREALEAA